MCVFGIFCFYSEAPEEEPNNTWQGPSDQPTWVQVDMLAQQMKIVLASIALEQPSKLDMLVQQMKIVLASIADTKQETAIVHEPNGLTDVQQQWTAELEQATDLLEVRTNDLEQQTAILQQRTNDLEQQTATLQQGPLMNNNRQRINNNRQRIDNNRQLIDSNRIQQTAG